MQAHFKVTTPPLMICSAQRIVGTDLKGIQPLPLEGTCALSLVSDFEVRLCKVGIRGTLAITPIQAVFLILESRSSKSGNAGMRQESSNSNTSTSAQPKWCRLHLLLFTWKMKILKLPRLQPIINVLRLKACSNSSHFKMQFCRFQPCSSKIVGWHQVLQEQRLNMGTSKASYLPQSVLSIKRCAQVKTLWGRRVHIDQEEQLLLFQAAVSLLLKAQSPLWYPRLAVLAENRGALLQNFIQLWLVPGSLLPGFSQVSHVTDPRK